MAGSIDIRVRYAETDQMGRAHHRHYLVWCELGRTSLMREEGVSYAEIERSGLMLPVARAELEYRSPVEYDDVVTIHTWVERVRSREVVFGYHLVRASDGATAGRARIVLVSTARDGRPARLPPELREGLERIGRSHGPRLP